MNSARKIAVAVAALSLALTGCTSVAVESPLGQGTCGSNPVSLVVSEDTVGDQISIDYTGPSDVTLFISPLSFYFDFEDLIESDGFELSFQSNSAEDSLLKLDPTDPNWQISSVDGGLVNWTFAGNIEELLVVSDSWTEDDLVASTFPAVVAVSCDSSLVTGDLVDSDDSTSDIIDGLDVAVAQALYPRHSTINDVNVISQETVIDGVDENLVIDFEFARGTAKRFPGFELASGYVMMAPIDLPEDFPTIPVTTFDGAWYNFLMSCAPIFGYSGEYCSPMGESREWSFTGVNEWVIPYADEMLPGEYLGVFVLGDDVSDPTQLRFAFTSFTFDEEGSFAIQDLDMGAPAVDERLAATGGDPNVIIWAVLGGLVVLAAVFLRSKRRDAQTESTIDPSDKKK